ncbi:MAG: translation elongation factor Ts [Chloroflexi bacterium]|nr:translation elongation factor Ts [Chloroflexota bacterium]
MDIPASAIKQLRQETCAGVMDCKRALIQANGDYEQAKVFLRQQGLAIAAKKANRVAEQGLVESYIHAGGRIGVLVEVNCETDFVARLPEFKELAHDLAMQIAAQKPEYVTPDLVPAEVLEAKRSAFREQALQEGKSPEVADKIVEDKLESFYQEVCLTEQPFIKDGELTVKELITQKIAKVGENIQVRRFMRYELGGQDT